jgi:hypothetical protein
MKREGSVAALADLVSVVLKPRAEPRGGRMRSGLAQALEA